ncbi:MAG: carboxypeptidase M32 [Patescibacteria group bacterium]|nr:carboxypeptidase M32 [Patescibacteria group bacterium]
MKDISNPNIKKLLQSYRQISLLNKISATLDWDLNVNLPPKASEGRARQSAFLAGLLTDKWLGRQFLKLLEKAREDKDKLNEKEQAILKNLEREGKYFFKVPKEIIVEMVQTTSEAFMVWQQAKKRDRFEDFAPYLRKIIQLNQIIAGHLGYDKNPYDALLDLYEPGLTSDFCHQIFGAIQPSLTQIVKKIKTKKKQKELEDLTSGLVGYPVSSQQQLALFVMKKMGFDLDAGRLDVSAHPFTTHLGHFDVRITSKYKENDFRDSLMSTMHESGHALYEMGIDEDFDETPLEEGVSLGIHESQSRFWENLVGRSPQFIEFLTPILQAFYQDQLSKFGSQTLVKLFNQVKPGFIRTEADEVTYNLHIMMRFELEDGLINNRLKVEQLPGMWREKMKKYLGVVPETDRDGVLQDVHWSYGNFGYFPTYTLGNLYAAQFAAKMSKELDLNNLMEKGELGTILYWLQNNIYQYGKLFWPDELVKKVTGENLNPQYFLDYINKKYSQIYNFSSTR